MRAVRSAKGGKGGCGDGGLPVQIENCRAAAMDLLSAETGGGSPMDWISQQALPLLRLLKNPNAFVVLWLLESLNVPAELVDQLRAWLESNDLELGGSGKVERNGKDEHSFAVRPPSSAKKADSGSPKTNMLKNGTSPGPGENKMGEDHESEHSNSEVASKKEKHVFWGSKTAEEDDPFSESDEEEDDGLDKFKGTNSREKAKFRGSVAFGGGGLGDDSRSRSSGRSRPQRDWRRRFTVDPSSVVLMAPPVEEIIPLLKNVPLFDNLSSEDLKRVAGIATRRMFGVDDLIVNFGEHCDVMHIIMDGEGKLCVPQHIGQVKNGDCFGEAGLHSFGCQHPAQITAANGPVSTLCIKALEFQSLNIKKGFEKNADRIARNFDGDEAGGSDESSRVKVTQGYTPSDADHKLVIESVKQNKVIGDVLAFTDEQYELIAKSVYLVELGQGKTLMRKGETGRDLYIVHEGVLEVSMADGKGAIMTMRSGDSFGETGLLYDAPRMASISAARDSKLWVLTRDAFRILSRTTHTSQIQEFSEILGRVPCLRDLVDNNNFDKIAAALEELSFQEGEEVCVQGEDEGILFICYEGECDQYIDDNLVKKVVKGDWIGEHQLVKHIPAEGTVRVTTQEAKFLALEASCLNAIIKAMANFKKTRSGSRKWSVDKAIQKRLSRAAFKRLDYSEMEQDHELARCEKIGTLGEGSFGAVVLMKDIASGQHYALKELLKEQIIKGKLEQMVNNERDTMMLLDSDFVVRLYRTYQDANSIFLMLEPVLGGELFDVYNERNLFGDIKHAKFYIGCVTLGLQHMHANRVIYRDLKLENCLLDARGYLKLTDMGIAKLVTGKTYTVCGTVDYFAPETLKQAGHNRGADWWATGVLLFIMFAGRSPFDAPEVAMIYKNIIKGFSKVRFPKDCPSDLTDVIKSLCRKKPEERVTMQKGGVDNLREMPFFSGMSWEELAIRTAEPPFIPASPDMEAIKNKQLSRRVDIDFEELVQWDGGFESTDAPPSTTRTTIKHQYMSDDGDGGEAARRELSEELTLDMA